MAILTILMPALNAMPYLMETFLSLKNQTFQDFNVLFWDNGSTDGTMDEARKWIPGKLAGRVVSHRPLPFHLCLNAMVAESQTGLLARMDADDLITPNRFELQLEALKKNPSLIAVGGQLETMDTKGKKIADLTYPFKYHEILCRLLNSSPLPHAAMMMHRDAIIACGNYQYPPPVEDFDLWFRLLKQGPVINLADTIYRYRIHGGGITERAKKTERHTRAIFECLKKNIPELFGIPPETISALIEKRYLFTFVPLLGAAKRIAKLSGDDLGTVLACPEFLFSARCYTAKWDVWSKVVYRFWGRNV